MKHGWNNPLSSIKIFDNLFVQRSRTMLLKKCIDISWICWKRDEKCITIFINLWDKINQWKNYRRYHHSVSSDSFESSEASDCCSDSFWSVSLDDSTLRDSLCISSIFRRFLGADFLSELLLLALLFLEVLTEYKLVLKHDRSLTLKLL